MASKIYYLYQHVREDKNEIFYIGIGTKRPDKSTFYLTYERAHSKARNNLWKKIVAKTNYKVEVALESKHLDFIREVEVAFIKLYGRIKYNNGILSNLAEGGEYNNGTLLSQEEVESRIKARHGDKFGLQYFEYTTMNSHAKFVCPEHGVFETSPSSILKNEGCNKCAAIRRTLKSTPKRIEYYLQVTKSRIFQIFPNCFDPSVFEKAGNKKRTYILSCLKHGKFQKHLDSLNKEYGCPKCGNGVGKRKINAKSTVKS